MPMFFIPSFFKINLTPVNWSEHFSSLSPIIHLNKIAVYRNFMHVTLMNDKIKRKYVLDFRSSFLKIDVNSG